MKFFAIFLLFAAVAFAEEEEFVPILRSDVHHHDNGAYSVHVETGNGITLKSNGHVVEGEDGDVVVVEGSYTYMGDDGKEYTIHYVADQNGFRADGAHLPVAPVDPHHH